MRKQRQGIYHQIVNEQPLKSLDSLSSNYTFMSLACKNDNEHDRHNMGQA